LVEVEAVPTLDIVRPLARIEALEKDRALFGATFEVLRVALDPDARVLIEA
jgi:hypothetical protein